MCNVKPYGYIYITTNLINGKRYIGQKASSVFVESYKGSGTMIKRAVSKYGTDNFKTVVLEWCTNQDELDQCERYWISLYNAVDLDDFYNLAVGGSFGCSRKGSHWNEESRKRKSESQLGSKNHMYGKQVSEETRRKLSIANTGKVRSVETRRRISECAKNISDETRRKMSMARKGTSISEETRRKLSIAFSGENNPNYGKHTPEETRKKISRSLTGRTMPESTKRLWSDHRKGEGNSFYGKKHTDEARKRMSMANLGCYWVTNGYENHYSKPQELDYYLSNGYYRGRTLKKRGEHL